MKDIGKILPRAATGITGIDEVLKGGLPVNRLYLLQGQPGVGKTTFSVQFLIEGVRQGEKGMYITLSETEEEIRSVAASHGWNLDGISLQELSAQRAALEPSSQNTLFYPSEVELGETMRRVLDDIDRVGPKRIVFDSLSDLRMLSQSPLRFRRQILALKQYLASRDATVILVEDMSIEGGDLQLQSLAHGVITLEQHSPVYGADRRRLRVVKLRGSSFIAGYHDFRIETGGMKVFPRLTATDYPRLQSEEQISSDSPQIDELIGGGLAFGTSTLILGPAGTGKSALASTYAYAAARKGHKSIFFLFEEGLGTFFTRARSLGADLLPFAEDGTISVRHLDPAELAPGELVEQVREAVENAGVRMVVIDSVGGYLTAMLEENSLLSQMHEFLNYLRRRGVVVILVMAQHGFLGPAMAAPVDVSYLADNVILLRYFEAGGHLLKAISVVKKRAGWHETSIREYRVDASGVRAGKPLSGFQGLMTGTPRFTGREEALLSEGHEPSQ
ncbi:MAG TPA: ATPase domain-containing protein [Thermoanaerobaculia bacterium]|nr:ATPase domain-containing protein [Thermoanaerobaculia bacterium]